MPRLITRHVDVPRIPLAKVVIFLIVCIILFFAATIHESTFLLGLDNPPYANSYNCTYLSADLLDKYNCFVASQGNPAPGLFIVYSFLSFLGIDYVSSSLLLAFVYVVSVAFALWHYRLPFFSSAFIASTLGFYSTYIIWSGHKQQLSLIFFFLLCSFLANTAKPRKASLAIASLFAVLSHAQQAVQLLFLFLYSSASPLSSQVYAKPKKSLFTISPRRFIVSLIVILFIALTARLGLGKFMGYALNSSKNFTIGNLLVLQFSFVLTLSIRSSKQRLLFLFATLTILIAPLLIGPSRSITLVYYFLMISFCDLSSRRQLHNTSLALASFLLLISFDISRGLLALYQGSMLLSF